MAEIIAVSDSALDKAAEILKSGGLVAIPTETVYGLAANACDGKAVARIFEVKGRPQFNPLISHFPSLEAMQDYVELDEPARTLAQHFWPGPLTLVLPRKENTPVSDLVCAGLPTMAVRVPAHGAAQDLLKRLDFPLAAPSANSSGRLSPTTPAHVAEDIGDKVDLILAAGPCGVGLESTVVDLSGDVPALLRPGAVTVEELSEVLELEITLETSSDKPKSPGMLLKHYAPQTPLRLNAVDLEPGEALLAFGSEKFMGIKGGGAAKNLPDELRRNLSENKDLHEAAANLFAMLKELDKSGAKSIAVMQIPENGLGAAINDRLKRAANA